METAASSTKVRRFTRSPSAGPVSASCGIWPGAGATGALRLVLPGCLKPRAMYSSSYRSETWWSPRSQAQIILTSPSCAATDWPFWPAARRSSCAVFGTSHPRDLRHSRSVPPSIPGIARTFASPSSEEHVLQDAPRPAPTCHYRTTARARWTGFTTLARDGRR